MDEQLHAIRAETVVPTLVYTEIKFPTLFSYKMKTKRLYFSMSRKGILPNPLAKLDKFINKQSRQHKFL